MIETKEFGGKRYKWYDSHKYKPTAKKQAWQLRQEGFWARVIRAKRKDDTYVYRVFTRGK